MWKEVLDFDMQATSTAPGTPVKDLVAGRTFDRPLGGFVGVSNVGRDTNWLGHHLAMANLYGFGRLAWNPTTSAQDIADEWTRLTFGHDPQVVETIVDMLLDSWPIYENYTGPLGVGTLTDIIHIHFGPGVESSSATAGASGIAPTTRASAWIARSRRAPASSASTAAVAAGVRVARLDPDELLLFMHHVPYTHVLRSGKTVIQHIYDAHYEGAQEAAGFVESWRRSSG